MDITGNLLFCTYKVAYDYKDFISWLAIKVWRNKQIIRGKCENYMPIEKVNCNSLYQSAILGIHKFYILNSTATFKVTIST